MRRILIGLLGLVTALGLALAGGGRVAQAAPQPPTDSPPQAKTSGANQIDELPNPLEDKRRALRDRALQDVVKGKRKAVTKNGSTVVKMGSKKAAATRSQRGRASATKTVDSYVELSREKTDKIFVVLAEFGDQRATDIDPKYGDVDTDPDTPGPTTFDGPLHNKIPEPDRSKDNSTIWQADYSADHYRQLYFGKTGESLKTYYQNQSSGRYSVDGEVTDWVKVKYNEARYGRSDGFPCASNVCSNTWNLLSDALTQWVADQKAQGRTSAEIKADLKSYDQWDRYDYDGDGNFNEPDGYLDHFQIVHAGGDQADGDPQQGEDAIWSHRWYAFGTSAGKTGPANNLLGGTQVGDTGLWVGDYTVQPENGGLSVFAHEYGHDLGLPDHYDTAGGPDNAVNWWTLMAQSRARAADDEGIGTRPADLGVWDKLQLGWLDYEVVPAGNTKTLDLGPHEYNSAKAQGVVVPLPKKSKTRQLVAPASGSKDWWSGSGDDLNSTLTRTVSVPSGSSTLGFKANYDIETDYDYAFVEVNDGSGWKPVKSSLPTSAENTGITGQSKGWVSATVDMSPYAGKSVDLRFRYDTDGGAAGNDQDVSNDGLFLDDIALTAGSTTVFSDGAESGTGGWTASGFRAVAASVTELFDHYYLASNRSYVSFDKYLKTGPYNFGFPKSAPDKAEFFGYEQGLLVNYWDTSMTDNNESVHPGEGLVLPIDAHPAPIYNLDGAPWRGRIQTYDAPFSLTKAASFTLHTPTTEKASYIRGQAAQPLFDDTRTYWYAATPTSGVKVPNVGVTMRVTKQSGTSMRVRVGVSPSTKSQLAKTAASSTR